MYDYDIRWGEHVYVGIGCYGEPSDQRSFSIKNNIVTDTRLNERLYVEDFDIHVGGGKVPKGKCKVLLGDPNKYTVIKDKESLAGGGNWTTVTQDTGTGALTCAGVALASKGVVASVVTPGAQSITPAALIGFLASGNWCRRYTTQIIPGSLKIIVSKRIKSYSTVH